MVIITGTSRGIGKALAEHYLALGKAVHGIGRTSTLHHTSYTHHFCDLSNAEAVGNLKFAVDDDELIFVHNAGMLGSVNRFSDLETDPTAEIMQVNFHAGTALLHALMKQYKSNQALTVVFISSGAGKRPIPSWAGYCASKAAVDLFLSTVQAEESEKGSNIRLYAFSPGVVDTQMQREIRNVSEANFSASERFHQLHEQNELQSPGVVAEKIATLIENRPEGQVLWNANEL